MTIKKKTNERAWVNDKPEENISSGSQLFDVLEDHELFHIGQSYEEEAAQTIQCKKCKGIVFNVGEGSFYTAIRCVNCRWEYCIHDG